MLSNATSEKTQTNGNLEIEENAVVLTERS